MKLLQNETLNVSPNCLNRDANDGKRAENEYKHQGLRETYEVLHKEMNEKTELSVRNSSSSVETELLH